MEKRRGYSALELMVVIAILGLLAVLVGPRVQQYYTRMELRRAVQELVSDLKVAQSRAKTGWESRRVDFFRFNGYLITNTITNAIEKEKFCTGPAITFTPTVNSFTFDRNGMTDTPVTIDVNSSKIETRTSYQISINTMGQVSYRKVSH